ncbi:MAG TPA: Yip1 family protein, partial [Methanoregula sp.]|nr:Yip1 family protein [Methanoregula sp.]
ARMLDSAMAGMGSLILIAAVVAAFIMIFVVWLIWAGAFFLISKLFKGTGSFERCLEVVGYGYVPQVIGSVIAVIAAMEYLPKVAVPALTSAALTNPQQIQDATTALMQDPAMVEYTQISAVISIVFLLWSASIWIFGIKQVRNISMRDAALTVGIPVVLLIIYQIYTLAGM